MRFLFDERLKKKDSTKLPKKMDLAGDYSVVDGRSRQTVNFRVVRVPTFGERTFIEVGFDKDFGSLGSIRCYVRTYGGLRKALRDAIRSHRYFLVKTRNENDVH